MNKFIFILILLLVCLGICFSANVKNYFENPTSSGDNRFIVSGNQVVSGTITVSGIMNNTGTTSFTTLTSSSATITNQVLADKFNDGVAYLKDGSLIGALDIQSSSATITNTLSTKVIDFAVNLDTTTAPSSTGIVGLTSNFKMYVSTGTSAGQWELIGSQS